MSATAHDHGHPETGEEWATHARDVVREAGHHRGAAREALIDLLSTQGCARTAQDIESRLRASEEGRSVARASIYRALELLHELRLVTRIDVGDGVTRYEPSDPAGHKHHHHLVCDACGQLVPFDDAGLERSIHALSNRLGVAIKEHEVTLRGTCGDCR